MPPKAADSAGGLGAKDGFFLVQCIKNSKEKLVPDYEAVALATGMSKGGASYVLF